MSTITIEYGPGMQSEALDLAACLRAVARREWLCVQVDLAEDVDPTLKVAFGWPECAGTPDGDGCEKCTACRVLWEHEQDVASAALHAIRDGWCSLDEIFEED